jgi:hypothetical protein
VDAGWRLGTDNTGFSVPVTHLDQQDKIWVHFFMIALFTIVLLLLMGSGIGIAIILDWINISIEIGIGMVIGLLSIGLSVFYTGRILAIADKESDDEKDHDKMVLYFQVLSNRRAKKSKKQII